MDFDFQQCFTKLWMHELKTDFQQLSGGTLHTNIEQSDNSSQEVLGFVYKY
jgi:hypothetical protein